MKNIILLSSLLVAGLVVSQLFPSLIPVDYYKDYAHVVKVLTTVGLGFIMIRVGYEFVIDKNNLREYGWDYLVAATAATLPWLFVAVYFVFVFSDASTVIAWKESLLVSRFASPTSAGILFSMLAAAGLAATWMYKKIRVLAIFDDLDTVLLMVPLKILLVGWKWQLGVVLAPMFIQLWAAWRYFHKIRIPITWPWVLGYSALITLTSEAINYWSTMIDEVVPIHIEVLLPAFVLGCMIIHQNTPDNGSQDIVDTPVEKRVTFLVSALFIMLVGLSMPAISGIAGHPAEVDALCHEIVDAYICGEPGDVHTGLTPLEGGPAGLKSPPIGWGWIAVHVLIVTLISNIGKIFPLFCYRKKAHWRERLALAVGMFPRGEVGAGVLIISIAYGIGGDMVTVAMLSLALNLALTGVFIVAVKKLLNSVENRISA